MDSTVVRRNLRLKLLKRSHPNLPPLSESDANEISSQTLQTSVSQPIIPLPTQSFSTAPLMLTEPPTQSMLKESFHPTVPLRTVRNGRPMWQRPQRLGKRMMKSMDENDMPNHPDICAITECVKTSSTSMSPQSEILLPNSSVQISAPQRPMSVVTTDGEYFQRCYVSIHLENVPAYVQTEEPHLTPSQVKVSTIVSHSTAHVPHLALSHQSSISVGFLDEAQNNSTPFDVHPLTEPAVEPSEQMPSEPTNHNMKPAQTVRVNQCSSCNKTYQHKRGLDRHLRKVHAIRSVLKCTQQCPLCHLKFASHPYFVSHVRDEHQVDVRKTHLEFEDLAKFNEWKEAMERETKSFYTLSSTRKRKLNKIYNFKCHRSGIFVGKVAGDRLRALKIKGSRKTGNACPARLTVSEKNSGSTAGRVSVTFVETHVGHDQDIGHLSLTAKARQSIASELLQGVSKRKVIEKIASNFSPSERISYITNKDLHNISAAFNLKEDTKLQHQFQLDRVHNVGVTDPILVKKQILIEELNSLMNVVDKSDSIEELDIIARIIHQMV